MFSTSGNYSDLHVAERKSGLLIPATADVKSADEKIAEQYEKDAISHAVRLMTKLSPDEIASFLFTKAATIEMLIGE